MIGAEKNMERCCVNKLEQLESLVNEQNCLLYCAGRVAKNVVKYFAQKKIKVNGILVTNLQGNLNEILGVPIFEVSEYSTHNNLSEKIIIVCALESIHAEIQQELIKYRCEKVVYISNALYQDIEHAIGDYELDIMYQISSLQRMIGGVNEAVRGIAQEQMLQEKRRLKLIPRPCLEYLVVNILDHCNLRCKGCDHFACIADTYFVPVEIIKKDVARMAEILHGDNVIKIAIMGGEPLLHPDLPEILKSVRSNFPYSIIRLTTNGILLLKQTNEFWQVCREQNITIVNTKYPINLDYEGMKKRAEKEKVRFQYYENTGDDVIKTSFKKIINVAGDSDPVVSFSKCHISNYGNFLMEGKLYGCPFSCQSNRIFNKRYNQNLRMTEGDYLDIYQVKSMQEIFKFAARPKYYCRYCCGVTRGYEWERSKQEMSEWVD